jgi:hypothetical protein
MSRKILLLGILLLFLYCLKVTAATPVKQTVLDTEKVVPQPLPPVVKDVIKDDHDKNPSMMKMKNVSTMCTFTPTSDKVPLGSWCQLETGNLDTLVASVVV